MVRKVFLGFVVLALMAVVAAFAMQARIGGALFSRAVESAVMRDTLASLDDGLHLGLCGTGSPMPNADRAGPCNVVVAGEMVFIVDIGEGGGRNLALMGINAGEVDALFLTHFHSDHIDGLGPLQLFHWTRGSATAPLPVYGPSGVEVVVAGFRQAYATDEGYRTAHHGEDVAPPSGAGSVARSFALEGDSAVVFERDGLTVTAFRVEHDPVEPAVGYRFDYRGRSLCLSGDTVRTPVLERACKGVDLLVHEALQPAMVGRMQAALAARGQESAAKIMADIKDYHATPGDAADSAQVAGARMLVLSHLVPPLPSAYFHPAFLGDAGDRFDGTLVVGEDGMLFTLLPGSDDIVRDKLM